MVAEADEGAGGSVEQAGQFQVDLLRIEPF
jgi:hypothetical protein